MAIDFSSKSGTSPDFGWKKRDIFNSELKLKKNFLKIWKKICIKFPNFEVIDTFGLLKKGLEIFRKAGHLSWDAGHLS